MKILQILGVRLDNLDIGELLEKIESFLSDGRQHYIVLPYSDFFVVAQKDGEFRRILNEADLCLCDGVGPVIASYILGGEKRLRGRIMGVDLVLALFAKFRAERRFFLFGAKEGVAQEAAKRILESCLQAETGLALKGGLQGKKQQANVNIAGVLDGYASDAEAIETINRNGAEILLVGLGMPKQEKWIYDNLKKMPSVKVTIGVGGAFDFISGRSRRAPRFAQAMGLEWLWRLFSQPRQWRKTWRSVIVFSWLVLRERF